VGCEDKVMDGPASGGKGSKGTCGHPVEAGGGSSGAKKARLSGPNRNFPSASSSAAGACIRVQHSAFSVHGMGCRVQGVGLRRRRRGCQG